MRRPAFVSGAQKVARPRDGASCSLRCAVMPTLCSGAAPPVVVTPAPTVGWDGHVDAISSGSCGRRCPLSPSCPTPSATGAVALIALLCGACADGGTRDGRGPQHGRVGKSSATRDELEEAESTHHTRSRGETEALGCLGLLLGPSFLRDAGGTIPRRWPPMPAAAHAAVRRGRTGCARPPRARFPRRHTWPSSRCSRAAAAQASSWRTAGSSRGSRTRGRASPSRPRTRTRAWGRVESAVSARLHT